MRKVLIIIIDFLTFIIKHGKCLFPIFLSKNIMGDNIFLGRFVHLHKCNIGSNTYIGNDCQFRNTSIGRYCSIAQNVKLVTGRHPTSTFVSTSPLFYSPHSCLGKGIHVDTSFKEYNYTDKGLLLEVGNDVWIGANVTILDGVKIGDGAIVAACSCVTKDVPPYAIVGGVPAKVIRYRFDENNIKSLMEIKWWEFDMQRIYSNASLFSNVDLFLNSVDQEFNVDK